MKVGYTEFSYGYAFTENLIRSIPAGSTGAPFFPNLVQEAKVGYDVNINLPAAPLFFQFKLPERMKKGTASEISNGGCPGLTVPFFRIGLMRHDLSKQHAHLIELENKFPSCVFYAAPHLADIHAFNMSYNLGRVHLDTTFFSPRQIGPLPDSKQHTIAYKNGLSKAFFCSKPQEKQTWTFDEVTKGISAVFDEKRFRDAPSAARTARDEVIELASPEWKSRSAGLADRIRSTVRNAVDADEPATISTSSSPGQREETITDFLVAREVARVDLGLEMVLAQPG